jgi:regulator of protease activity HflC (stomatin/prohibitin superfamily)
MAEKEAFVDPNLENNDSEQVEPQGVRMLKVSRAGSALLRACATVLVLAVFSVAAWCAQSLPLFVVGVVVTLLFLMSFHVVMEWENAVVTRWGKFNRVSGPGAVFTIPFVEYVASTVDMRIRTTTVKAEKTLTSDLVPVDVDAVLFWVVWNAKDACLEVREVGEAVLLAAQTTLRDVIGGLNASEMGMRRRQLDEEIFNILAKKTTDWGVNVLGVEIRNIEIPEDLQESMSSEARAEREYNARLLIAEAEEQIADMYVDAARKYKQEDAALKLRAMNLVSDSVKEQGGLVVLPSDLSDAFSGLGKASKE